MIICPHTTQQDCRHLAERIRTNISETSYSGTGITGKQTVSLGIIAIDAHCNLEKKEIFHKLDQALYEAKRRGRNRTHTAEPV